MSPSVPPGFYKDPQTINWSFAADVTGVAVTVDDPSPVTTIISDTNNVPVIAKYELGKAKLTIDSGLDKCLNSAAQAAGLTFAQSNGTYKLYSNILKWLANPTKLAAGNNKLLVLGNCNSTYGVKNTTSTGTSKFVSQVAALAGLVPTIKNVNDWPEGVLIPTLSELQQYCAVLVMCTLSSGQLGASMAFVNDLETGAKAGDFGVAVITDHDPDFTALPKAIGTRFGGFSLSGSYTRPALSVANVRNRLGESPFLNGLLDTDNIYPSDTGSGIINPSDALVAPPSMSKYIAYDNLTPRNPFIAVTEDGRGRVVYDGGFPKFYNDYTPPINATFGQLSGSFKYLYNALQWVANSVKVAAGFNKFLVLGDANAGENYNVVDSGSNRFNTSLINILTIAGYGYTFKTRASYGGVLNPTLAELEQYCGILVMSSTYAMTNTDYITSSAVSDIATFRENGGGVILITDHGPVLNNATEAANNKTGFFNVANQIALKFGAYFTGDYTRTPVNVGWIRANYGDHPLYKMMSDSEDIVAGGSESKVVVTSAPINPPASFPPVVVSKPGMTTLQYLLTKTDGSVSSHKFVYSIASGEILYVKDGNALDITINELDYGNQISFNIRINGSQIGTIFGVIELNGIRVGDITWDSTNKTLVLFYTGGDRRRTLDGDVYEIKIVSPFTYSKTITINKRDGRVANLLSYARLMTSYANAYSGAGPSTIARVKDVINNKPHRGFVLDPNFASMLSPARAIRNLYSYDDGTVQIPEAIAQLIFATKAEANTYMASNLAAPLKYLYVADEDSVYGFMSGSWVRIAGLTPLIALSGYRDVANKTNGELWTINRITKKLVKK